MGEEPSAHGRRMWGCQEGCSTHGPPGRPWAGGEAALLQGRGSGRAQPCPSVTEESQEPGNPVLSYLGQETDAAWWRKHLQKINAPCAFPGRNPGGTGGAGRKRPDSAPARAGAAQLGLTASPLAASVGMEAQRVFYFSLEAWGAGAREAQISHLPVGKGTVPSSRGDGCSSPVGALACGPCNELTKLFSPPLQPGNRGLAAPRSLAAPQAPSPPPAAGFQSQVAHLRWHGFTEDRHFSERISSPQLLKRT